MKTHLIIFGMAALAFMSCHNRSALVKSSPCCAKDAASVTAQNQAAGGNSVYQLTGTWTDQNAKQLTLNKLQGHPQIVAMIFTHCTSICPRVVEKMKAIRDSLPPSVRKEVGGVLVSFDPERDTPAQLTQYAAQRQLDNQWELLQGNASQVRELSMALNVKYQKPAGGNYSHTGNIYILDKEGNIVQSVDGFGRDVRSADAVLTRLVHN